MAGPLRPPHPGFPVPAAGPPEAPPRWLWARVEFGGPEVPGPQVPGPEVPGPEVPGPGVPTRPARLGAALAHLAAALAAHPTIETVFLAVLYPEAALDPKLDPALARTLAALHRRFAATHPQVDTWLPRCLPVTEHAALAPFASPPHCADCFLYQTQRCRGRGHDALPWSQLAREAPPALPHLDLEALGPEAFAGPAPVACWQPSEAILDAFTAAAQAAGGTVWDLGGGNGYLAARLARRGLQVTVVERHPPAGPPPAGVERWTLDAHALLDPNLPAGAAPPAAVVVSWPPTGEDFGAVVAHLDPAVVLWATDADGLCGRDPRQAAVVAEPGGLTWFAGPPPADFAAGGARPLRATWRRPGLGHREAVIRLYARSAPEAPPPEAPPPG